MGGESRQCPIEISLPVAIEQTAGFAAVETIDACSAIALKTLRTATALRSLSALWTLGSGVALKPLWTLCTLWPLRSGISLIAGKSLRTWKSGVTFRTWIARKSLRSGITGIALRSLCATSTLIAGISRRTSRPTRTGKSGRACGSWRTLRALRTRGSLIALCALCALRTVQSLRSLCAGRPMIALHTTRALWAIASTPSNGCRCRDEACQFHIPFQHLPVGRTIRQDVLEVMPVDGGRKSGGPLGNPDPRSDRRKICGALAHGVRRYTCRPAGADFRPR